MIRPTTFEETMAACGPSFGHYRNEASALWNIVQQTQPRRIAEVGRFMSGGTFFFCCASPNVEYVLSLDLFAHRNDPLVKAWLDHHGIENDIVICDSTTYKPIGEVELVYIDGGHDGCTVAGDIEVWRDHTALIGFHDYADRKSNRHGRYFPELVTAVTTAAAKNCWTPLGPRGRSEIVFRTNRALIKGEAINSS